MSLQTIGQTYGQAGIYANQNELDQYQVLTIVHPAVDVGWFGTKNTATTAAIVNVNALPDWPRNLCYSVTGVAGGMGGTFTAQFVDQFGGTVTETVTIGSANGGGTAYGTQICAKFIGGTFSPQGLGGTAVGTSKIGLGTIGTSNWFGLLTKIGGTQDIKIIAWDNNGTVTTLNGGTNYGSLISTTQHAFQGTSGVAITDSYRVILKSSFDNREYGTMCAL